MPNTNFQTFHQMGQAINEVVRQATGRDAVQNIDMDHVTVAQNSYYEEVTASGSMVSFTDRVGNTPLEKCVVQIDPVQDLHGFDRPWAGGAGKNKLKPVKDAGQSTTYGGITVEFNADGSVSVFGTKDAQDGFKRITFGTAHLGAGSYIVTGQNLADPSDKLTLQVMNGNTQIYNMSYSSAQSFSFNLTDEADIGINIGFRDGCSLTSPVKMYPMIRLASVTDDTYEPYSNICPITGWAGANIHVSPTTDAQDGTTYSIAFPSEAGTVYGGSLDVMTGVLTVDRAMVDMGTLDWTYMNDYKAFLTTIAGVKAVAQNAVPNMISSMYVADSWLHAATNPTIDGKIIVLPLYDQMRARNLAYSDAVSFKTEMSGVPIVYELANSVTYQLTPQEVETLLGTNNIWADTGDIEVKYKVLKELY